MGSTGQTIGAIGGAVVGGVLGYFGGDVMGGTYLGASIGMAVGTAVDPPGAKMGGISQYQKQDVYYNTIAHNLPVPIVYGVNRVAGNLLWLGNVRVEVTESDGGGKQGGSGGGGKKSGGGQQQVTVYGDFAIALSEGEIREVTEVFIGDKLISETAGLTYTVYLGTPTQTADPRLTQDLKDLAPAFRHTAYIAMGGGLGSYPAIPQVNTEVVGKFGGPETSGYENIETLQVDWGGWDTVIPTSDVLRYNPVYNKHFVYTDSGPFFYEVTDAELLEYTAATSWVLTYTPQIIAVGVASGVSGRILLPDNSVLAEAVEQNGEIALIGSFMLPSSGRVQLYSDGAAYSTIVTPGGSYPDIGSSTLLGWDMRLAYDVAPEFIGRIRGNPALIVRDLLSHPRYGVAVNTARFDDLTFTAAHSYCVGLIPYKAADGSIGSEQRFCLDYIVDQHRPIVEHLRDMLASFGGFLTWSQGIVKLHIEQPGATVAQSFGMAEIAADSFRWKRQSYRERPNVVRVEYVEPGALTPEGPDPGLQADLIADSYIRTGSELSYKKEYKTYRQDFVEASDPWDIERTGERRDRVFNLTGIKRRTQAQRMAYYYLNKAIHCPHACAFRVGVNALQAEVGDVVAISHDIPKWQGKLFRIAEIMEAENDELVLGCLEYSEAVYADGLGLTPHGQDTLYGTASGRGGMPYHVGRFSVYERPYEAVVEVAYTRVATVDLFAGIDLYLQRGAADPVIVANGLLSSVPTAYLTTVIASLTRTTEGDPGDTSGVITLRGIPDGYSAQQRRFDSPSWVDTLYAQAVASMGTIVLSSDCTSAGGYITLFSDGASYTTPAPGNWPRATLWDASSWHSGDVFDLKRVPQLVTAIQTWLAIDRPLGGWTAAESLRLDREELGYFSFTDSMLTGLTRGANGTTATSHTGVASLGMVAVYSGGPDVPQDVTAAMRDPLTLVEVFGQNSSWVYFGASSKFSAVNLWLARNAAQMLGLAGEYSIGQGRWASLMSSGFLPARDTSSGMQASGQIGWEPPGNWAVTNEVTSGGLMIGDTTSRFYMRLMRVASLCTAPPIAMEATLTNDTLVVVRKPGTYLYPLVLADSGQQLTFKAISRSVGGLVGDSIGSPIAGYENV